MIESILTSVKKTLNLDEAYTAFDQDIILHINSVLSTINQLGVGPEQGFMIDGPEAVWADLLGDETRHNHVKSYIYLRVRLLFDPPATSFLLSAYQAQITELEWRINSFRESYAWVDPTPNRDVEEEDLVLDGGAP